MKFLHKKAVSPIIAAVLLVVITIAIGATTMAFIRSLTDTNLQKATESTAKISCGSEIDLEIPLVKDEYKICYYEDGTFNVLLHNTGNVDVKGFDITLILNNGSITTNNFDNINLLQNTYYQANLTPLNTVVNATVDVAQWRVEPKIRKDAGKELMVCTDSAIVREVEDIELC